MPFGVWPCTTLCRSSPVPPSASIGGKKSGFFRDGLSPPGASSPTLDHWSRVRAPSGSVPPAGLEPVPPTRHNTNPQPRVERRFAKAAFGLPRSGAGDHVWATRLGGVGLYRYPALNGDPRIKSRCCEYCPGLSSASWCHLRMVSAGQRRGVVPSSTRPCQAGPPPPSTSGAPRPTRGAPSTGQPRNCRRHGSQRISRPLAGLATHVVQGNRMSRPTMVV